MSDAIAHIDFTPEHLAALDRALARMRTEEGPMFEASHWATLLWDRAHQVNDELAPAIMALFDALAEAQGVERVAMRCWKTEVQGLTAQIQQWRGELEAARESRAEWRDRAELAEAELATADRLAREMATAVGWETAGEDWVDKARTYGRDNVLLRDEIVRLRGLLEGLSND